MLNDKLTIGEGASLREALKRLDAGAERILFVVDGQGVLLGTLTDGDARRALLEGRDLKAGILDVYNHRPVKFRVAEDFSQAAEEAFKRLKITHIPLVNSEGVLVDCLRPGVGADQEEAEKRREKLDLPVVIMAGGRGSRMAPFTHVLPKPLIPIGEKTVVELIMDEFARYGIRDFRLTVCFRGEMIRAYFQGSEREYGIKFVWENDFSGTAGSIKLVDNLGETFIVSNCDIIVKADLQKVVAFHRKNRAALTVISSIQHHTIPYGVIEFSHGGRVTGIREKPEYSFPINTGVYVLEKLCLDYIPTGVPFNMTDLIAALLQDGKTVYTYPINEKEYLDIGQWEEYRRAVSLLESS